MFCQRLEMSSNAGFKKNIETSHSATRFIFVSQTHFPSHFPCSSYFHHSFPFSPSLFLHFLIFSSPPSSLSFSSLILSLSSLILYHPQSFSLFSLILFFPLPHYLFFFLIIFLSSLILSSPSNSLCILHLYFSSLIHPFFPYSFPLILYFPQSFSLFCLIHSFSSVILSFSSLLSSFPL
jgi:hypothetical protein